MTELNHGHHHSEGHIPPPDLHREKRLLGFKPLHVILGALVLIAILVIYMLLTARAGY
jgi:hypothetical protein